MLFHVGALWRLNELGCLSTVKIVSSVSGGSIVAGVLGANWSKLTFDEKGVATNFPEMVAKPIMAIAQKTVDWQSTLWGFVPTKSAGEQLENAYQEHLVKDAKLSDLPETPEFLFNASSLQSGRIWVFSKKAMGDSLVAYVTSPNVKIATAMAASRAYPPFMAPYTLSLKNVAWRDSPERGALTQNAAIAFRENVVLVDGGIIDNLGLESLWDKGGQIFASDGGGGFDPTASPATDWARLSKRVVDMIHGQHDFLRRRILMERFKALQPDGVYWSIHQAASHCDVTIEGIDEAQIKILAGIETRLKGLDEITVKKVVNWGYLSADRSLPYLQRIWNVLTPRQFSSSKYPYPEAQIALKPYRPFLCKNRSG